MAEKKTSTRKTKKSSELPTKESVSGKDSAPAVDLEKAAAEKLAAEKATAEKLAAEKAAAEKLAAEKATAEKLAAEKTTAEKLAAEKADEAKAASESLVGKKVKTPKSAIFFVKEQLDENTVLIGRLKKSRTYKYDISSLEILD